MALTILILVFYYCIFLNAICRTASPLLSQAPSLTLLPFNNMLFQSSLLKDFKPVLLPEFKPPLLPPELNSILLQQPSQQQLQKQQKKLLSPQEYGLVRNYVGDPEADMTVVII